MKIPSGLLLALNDAPLMDMNTHCDWLGTNQVSGWDLRALRDHLRNTLCSRHDSIVLLQPVNDGFWSICLCCCSSRHCGYSGDKNGASVLQEVGSVGMGGQRLGTHTNEIISSTGEFQR